MGRLGFGAGRFRSRRRGAAVSAVVIPDLISPSAAWTGAAGSGFAVVPSDSVRTTAKPACRLLVPPNQAFTDQLLVCVTAWANDSGSLLTNCGLAKVTAHYEGTSTDILAPSFQTFNDANGVPRTYFGWWIALKRVGNGHARLYFEAEARDATMQKRVVGPFQFSPQAALYDHEIELAATPAQIVGQRYKTLAAALDYLRVNTRNFPRITVTESGTYDITASALGYQGQGYVTIEAAVPVTFGRAAPSSANTNFRPRYDGLRFKGSNVTVDFANVTHLVREVANTRAHWFDGCAITASTGRDALFLKNHRAAGSAVLVQGAPFLTECTITNVPNFAVTAGLARGNTTSSTWGDMFSSVCVIGNVSSGHSSSGYTNDLPAMTVKYNGAGASATLELSGGQGATTRTFNAKVAGASVGTFAASGLYTASGGAFYNVSDVVAWLNTLTDWSATLLDNTRIAASMQTAGTVTAWGPIDVRTATVTLYTKFDIHADYAQIYSTENFVVEGNLTTDVLAQMIFFKDGPVKDGFVINNAFGTTAGSSNLSQFADVHGHIVVAHNSWSEQGFALRTDLVGATPAAKYNPDGYCLFAANVGKTLYWYGGTTDAHLVIKNTHLFTGANSPSGSTGTTIGGVQATLFANAPSGDFTPQGDLLANRKTAAVKYDRAGAARGSKAPAGAVA